MSNTPADSGSFQAGCARVDITPPLGVSLAGYFHDRRARAVRDHLYANAMVLAGGNQRAALVSCDLICMSAAVAQSAKSAIHEEIGISPDHVLISATHTHTGPELRRNSVVSVNEKWRDNLPARIAEAVRTAASRQVPVTLRAGTAHVEGLSWNRLFRLKDGNEVFGAHGREEQVVREAGPIDPQLQTLSAVTEDGSLVGVLVNFALHPDVIGGGAADFISADWPGELVHALRAVYGRGAVALFLQGAAGDINHVPHTPTRLPTRGPEKAVQLGRALAGAAMTAMEKAEPMTACVIDAKVEHLAVPYYTRDQDLACEVAALKTKAHPTDFERYIIERFESWPHDGRTADVPVQAFRIGNMGLVGLPAEVFVRIGLEIKEFSPAKQTMIAELANARVSTYVPTGDQARRGAYGAKPILSRWLDADAGRRMADAAQRLLWELWERT